MRVNISAQPLKGIKGEPSDKYEQEADRLASAVVEQINAPAPTPTTQGHSLQRMEDNIEELQTKPDITPIQRQVDNEEELQVQSTEKTGLAIAPRQAPANLESDINSAKGGGQPLADSIREPMEQAFEADFSGVRVHTDSLSYQLNQSIQAKAFTTRQDVFFRQGAYEY